VSVNANKVSVSGKLKADPDTIDPGNPSTVYARAGVYASGDESGVQDEVWVQSRVESAVDINLQPGATGEAKAYAKGTATATGELAGVGEVSSSAKGTTEASAKARGTDLSGAVALSYSIIEGFAGTSATESAIEGDPQIVSNIYLANNAEAKGSPTALHPLPPKRTGSAATVRPREKSKRVGKRVVRERHILRVLSSPGVTSKKGLASILMQLFHRNPTPGE